MSQAQEEDVQQQKFGFIVDYSRFRLSDSLVYFEFYGAIPRNLVEYIPEGDRFRTEFVVDAQIFQSDTLFAAKKWRNVNYADSLAAISSQQRLYCINHFALPKGSYDFKIGIKDVNSDSSATYEMPMELDSFSEAKLAISDLQLSSRISRDTTKNAFNKNGYTIIPHPSRLYGIGLPILYLYAEIYNLSSPNKEDSKYMTNYKILDTDGNIVKTVDSKIRKKPGESAVEVNGLNVVTLVSGAYIIQVEVEDLDTEEKIATQSRFYVYRQADFAEGGARFEKTGEMTGTGSAGMDADRYDVMTKKELEQEFEYAEYIATREEKNTFKKLNLEGKRNFIKSFWARRDQTPNTPVNEFKREYLKRVEYANRMYKGTFREGWKTDRGRVLLIYGQPDERELYPFSTDTKAHEVWLYYSIQGGVQFIFADKREMGDYELVHSTARGELYDPDWQRFIR
jgi:GWxTD domain-containing protein